MIIRPANPNDVDTICDFNLRMAWETEKRKLDPKTARDGVLNLLNDPAKGTYYLAERVADGAATVVGQLMITYEWSDWRNGNFWWIQSVYVREDCRGSGVFRALYDHVQAAAKQRSDVCGLRLYVDGHNHGAQETYKRLGMKATDYKFFEVDFVLPH